MTEECIFCKIVKGDAPSYTVYEDELVKAFFDIYPAIEGHTLVVPKKHYKDIYDVPEEELKRIIITIKRLALSYKKSLGVKAVNIMHGSGAPAQQDVFHFHMHLVPRQEGDHLNLWYKPMHKEITPKFNEILETIKKGFEEDNDLFSKN